LLRTADSLQLAEKSRFSAILSPGRPLPSALSGIVENAVILIGFDDLL
jgi:hypothetical protein